MAPYVLESAGTDAVSKATIQSKSVTLNHDQVPKPVADDFMYDFKYNHTLPTTDVLGVKIPTDCDAYQEAEGIVARLFEAISEEDPQAFAELFLHYGETLHKKGPKSRLWLTSLISDLQACGATNSHSPGTSAHLISERPSLKPLPTFCLKLRLKISTFLSLRLLCLTLTLISLSCNLLYPSRLRLSLPRPSSMQSSLKMAGEFTLCILWPRPSSNSPSSPHQMDI